MLNMKKGCRIENADKLYEQYEKTEYGYIANINAEKIISFLSRFISMQDELVFFFLEVPSSLYNETVAEDSKINALHKDVYYIDNLKKEEALILLQRYGELLVGDGLCSFGFGLQSVSDEISVNKYNIVRIYSKSNNSYISLFEEFSIPKTQNLITAWDTFTEETPGVCEKIEIDGKDVYSIIDDLKDWGIYFAERRKDN